MTLTVDGITYSQTDLDNMDPLERSILEGAQDDDAEGRAGPGEDDQDEDDDKDAGAAPAPAPAAPAPAPAAPAPAPAVDAAAEAAAAEAAATAAPAPAAEAPAAPVSLLGDQTISLAPPPPTTDVTALKTAAEAAATAKAEAFAKMMDGTIESAEYLKAEQAAQESMRALDKAETRNANIVERYQERAQEAYSGLFNAAEAKLAAAGIQVTEEVRAELSEFTATFAGQLLKQGVGDGTDLKNSRMSLERGMLAVAAARGISLTAAAPPATPGKPATAPSRAGKAPDLSKVPPNLAGVPVGGASAIEGDKFAHINSLTDPDEQELAIARLSPAELDAYLGGA